MSATLEASVMQIRLDQINSLDECERTKDEQPHLQFDDGDSSRCLTTYLFRKPKY